MKRLLWLALAGWLAASSAPARTAPARPPSPAREAAPPAAPVQAPGALALTDEPEPAGGEPPAPPPDFGPPPAADSAAGQDPSTRIADPVLQAYFALRPPTYLIDPQKLLDPPTTQDQLAFLTSHAADSAIDLFIYVFDREQEIPSDVREEEVIERFFASGRPAMIVYYYLGAPQRAAMYLSPALTEVVAASERQRTLQNAVAQAMTHASPQDQMQAFSAYLASRSYWIEQLLASAGDPDLQATQARAAKLVKKAPSLAERWAQWRPLVESLTVPGLLLASVVAAAVGLAGWLRWRATYRFPEFTMEPRLGGEHAAGVGAVISFASADLPPASQREQVAECVRRG